MKTETTTQPTAVNLSVEAPEWSYIGATSPTGNNEYPDRVNVYQNGVLVIEAIDDEPTRAAIDRLTRQANAYDSDQRKIKALTEALEESNAVVRRLAPQVNNLPSERREIEGVLERGSAALALAKEGR